MRRILTRFLLFVALATSLVAGTSTAEAQSHSRAEIEVLAEYYAAYYGVPITLVRRVINRESTFNPSARNGPYYGLMQILPATAGQMGYRGSPEGLLNAETNLIHAVKYLRGAWLLAGGSESRAVQLYAAGYYYVARDAGMLEETGLRPGPRTIPTPQPVGVEVALASIAPQAAAQPQSQGNRSTLLGMLSGGDNAPATPVAAPAPAPEAAVAVAEAVAEAADEPTIAEADETPVVAVALGILPPTRPALLDAAPVEAEDEIAVAEAAAETEAEAVPAFGPPVVAGVTPPSRAAQPAATPADDAALVAIAAVSAPDAPVAEGDETLAQLGFELEWASAYAELRPAYALDGQADLLEATFALLDPMQAMIVQSNLVAGEDGFMPPLRPDGL